MHYVNIERLRTFRSAASHRYFGRSIAALCSYRVAQAGPAMTPEYRIEAEKRITSYLNRNDVKNIKYMQVEQTFDDLGVEIHVWNVKAEGGNWWVVEGEGAPMNLYTQNEYYFSADEAYSFHMGITQRLQARHHKEFKHVIDELPLDIEWIKSIGSGSFARQCYSLEKWMEGNEIAG